MAYLVVQNVALLTHLTLASKISVLGSITWSEQVSDRGSCDFYQIAPFYITNFDFSISIAEFYQVSSGWDSRSLF